MTFKSLSTVVLLESHIFKALLLTALSEILVPTKLVRWFLQLQVLSFHLLLN